MMEEERIVLISLPINSSVPVLDRIIELMITENLTTCINDPRGSSSTEGKIGKGKVKYLIKRKYKTNVSPGIANRLKEQFEIRPIALLILFIQHHQPGRSYHSGR